MQQQIWQQYHTAGSETKQVFTGPGVFGGIIINTTAAGAISLIDNTGGSTVNIGSLKASVAEGTYMYNCQIAAGLRVILAGATDATILWKQG